MRHMNYNGHKNDQMCFKRGEPQTFWDIRNAGYEHQLPVIRHIVLLTCNWMTNISRKRFNPKVENISPVESPHKGQWRGALCFLWFAPEQTVEQTMETPVRRHRAQYDVTFSTVVYWTHWEGNSVVVNIISANGFAQHWLHDIS